MLFTLLFYLLLLVVILSFVVTVFFNFNCPSFLSLNLSSGSTTLSSNLRFNLLW